MVDLHESGSPYSASGALMLKSLIPYIAALLTVGSGLWIVAESFSQLRSTQTYQEQQISALVADDKANNASQIASTQVFQGQQIAQLIADDKAGQTLSYSIQSQLAQLNQSVADIKALTTQHGNP